MNIHKNDYLDSLKACFIGKNIGGTIGAPYEGKREVLNVLDFPTGVKYPIPNDDLDLQLAWLCAFEKVGPQGMNGDVLKEYWLNCILPDWSEYGIGKVNLQSGIPPMVSGEAKNNIWMHSNGSWITTELWACLNPGAPDSAIRYTLYDSTIDHGRGEGTIAAMFIAAMESVAFFEKDIHKLIQIGLSKIPDTSRVSQSVRLVLTYFQEKKTWLEARNAVVTLNQDFVDGWFQAPSNVAFVIIGLLYGEGDYKKSILTAIDCSDDTDCTGGTLGSLLGILYGEKIIPVDWKKKIGNQLVTWCLNTTAALDVPATIDELVNRIAIQASYTLLSNKDKVEITEKPTFIQEEEFNGFCKGFGDEDERDEIRAVKESLKQDSFIVRLGLVSLVISYENSPSYQVGEDKKIGITLINNIKTYTNKPHSAKLTLRLKEGLTSDTLVKNVYLPCWTSLTKIANSEKVYFTFHVDKITPNTEVILEVQMENSATKHFVSIPFFSL